MRISVDRILPPDLMPATARMANLETETPSLDIPSADSAAIYVSNKAKTSWNIPY